MAKYILDTGICILIENRLKEITPKEVALLFASMTVDEQVDFYNSLYTIGADWMRGQVSYSLRQPGTLTEGGEKMIRHIGAFNACTSCPTRHSRRQDRRRK